MKNKLKEITVGLAAVLLTVMTGCVGGYVDGGGGGVVVADPVVVGVYGGGVYRGGGYERGRDVHGYSDRGSASRAVAHGGGRIGKR
ncbi:MAG TPA: hypothetical protein VK731_08535 [Candidatus Cybelea sp.]|nr:hypothetical protein [Candidatus Cybelea sp.]